MSLLTLADGRRTWLAYAGLIILLSALTFGSLANLLLYTHEDEIFRDHVKADGLAYFFQPAADKEFNAPGRPITEIVRYFGYLVWGNDPGAFHLYCVAMHALASLLLAFAARQLGAPLALSFLGGLLFLLNVSHFRGVHYISGLDYPLAQVWSLGAVICYLRYRSARHLAWFLATGICLVLGTASHQASIMVLPFLLYGSWAQGDDLKKALRPLVPLGLVLLLVLYLLLQITDREGATTWVSLRLLLGNSPLTTLPAMGRVMLWLAGRLFSTAHWLPLTVYELAPWEIFFGGLVLVALAVLVYRRVALLAEWSVWIVLSLVPFIMVDEEIHIHLVHGPSRHLYMASAGSSMLLAWALQRGGLALVRRFATWGYVAYAVVLVALGASSYACLKKVESLSHYAIGRFYLISGDFATGLAQLERAIAEGSDIIPLEDAYYRLCVVKLSTGAGVERELWAARRALPESRRLDLIRYALLSLARDSEQRLRGEDQVRTICETIEKTERLDGRAMLAAVYYNTGLGSSQNRDFKRAVAAYKNALELDRSRPDILFNLGLVFCEDGQLQKGVEAFRAALALDPANAVVHARMGRALFDLGSVDAAIATYERALALDGTNVAARINLGWALYSAGHFEEAVQHYLVALESQTNDVALFNLGLARLALCELDAAKEIYARAVAEFGATRGEAIGAVADLRALAARRGYADAAREILQTHWGE